MCGRVARLLGRRDRPHSAREAGRLELPARRRAEGFSPARIGAHLPQAAHRLSPELLKAFHQAVGELAVSNQERGEPSFLHERVIERQDDRVVIHDVKGMAKFS